MGLRGLEPLTPALSAQCSNQLSYRPECAGLNNSKVTGSYLRRSIHRYGAYQLLCNRFSRAPVCTIEMLDYCSNFQKGGDPGAPSGTPTLLRLRPSYQTRLRQLPLVRVGIPILGVSSFHDVTGGVYKARERIHRTIADARLLATPASCRRVAAYNPN